MHVTSGLAHTDVYVRLCDVAPSGKVTHVAEALRCLTGDQQHIHHDPTRPSAVILPTTQALRR
ncbi:hypothetical protein AB0M44_15415 [Streptosporangium subroseum]|uniref:hypothetical protein n=1 Tax=Streptosporangium subroseum TaxID=106412 RepID=UPI0034323AEA